MPTYVFAANYSCPGEDVANVNAADSDAFKSYSEDSSGSGGYSRYFKFSTDVDGSITISFNSDNYNHKMRIGTSCGDNDIYGSGQTKSASKTFNVSSGTTYYVQMKEKNFSNKLQFDIDFDFLADIDDVLITKNVNNSAPKVGETVTFTITATNRGSDKRIEMRDGMEPDTQEHANDWSTTYDAFHIESYSVDKDDVTCTIEDPDSDAYLYCVSDSDYSNNESFTTTVVARILKTGTLCNTAHVYEYFWHWKNSDNACVDAVTSSNDLRITDITDSSDPAAVDSNVTYNISIDNTGDTATGIELNSTISNGTWDGVSPSGWSCSGGSAINCTRNSDLNDGESETVALIFHVPSASQTITLTSSIDSYQDDTDTSNNTASESTDIVEIVENANDLCYDESTYEGMFCIDMGICHGGIGCRNTFPLRNIGDSNLSDIHAIFDETGMGGSFGDNCGVEPSGNCETVHDIDMGPFGFFGTATKFDLDNEMPPDDDSNSIWAENFIEGSCLGGDSLYGKYIKDGVLHRGPIYPCGDVPAPQEPEFNTECGIFPSVLTTYEHLTLQKNDIFQSCSISYPDGEFTKGATNPPACYEDALGSNVCSDNDSDSNNGSCNRAPVPQNRFEHVIIRTSLTTNTINSDASVYLTSYENGSIEFTSNSQNIVFDSNMTYENSSRYAMVFGDIVFSGNNQTLTLKEGDYYFKSLDFQKNGITIIPEGLVRIFIQNDFNYAGNASDISDSDALMFVYAKGDVTISSTGGGNGWLGMFIYTQGDVTIESNSNTKFFGGITAEGVIDVNGNNFQFEYNKAGADSLGFLECATNYCDAYKNSPEIIDDNPGFTRIDPFNNTESIFEVFCTDTDPSETLLSLPIKNTFNNFVFDDDSLDSEDYYSEANNHSITFNAIKVKIDPSTRSLQVDTNASNSGIGVMGEYFSNINLIGTPFAIDWDNTTISHCDESKLRKGYHGQVVKINTLDYTNARCKIESMSLKLLDDYTYLEYNGEEVLESTCKLMAESVPDNYLDSSSVKGHYWINAAGGERGGSTFTNDNRPYIAYCWYQTDLDWVWTFLLAMDGKRTISKNDLVNKSDTCSELGLWPFVANKEKSFERVRKFLAEQKDDWINYTGTIEEKLNALYGATYYLGNERTQPIWPYGSFGVYFPTNGNNPQNWGDTVSTPGWMSGSPMHNQQTITEDYPRKNNDSGDNARDYYSYGNYSNTDASTGSSYSYTDTMGSKGWVSILGEADLNKTDEWFISRSGAGDNIKRADPYYEANGNYDAGCWLNFLFDEDGRVRHNDDWNCNYPYYDYMCIAEDNYDFATRYGLIEGPFKVIERTEATYDGQTLSSIDTNITTKIVNRALELDVILLDDNLTRIDKAQNISAGMYVTATQIVGANEVPVNIHYLGEIYDFNSSSNPSNNYNDDGRFEFEATNWPDNVEKWQYASKRLFIQFKYCRRRGDTWDTCWDNTVFPPQCKIDCDPSIDTCACQVADSNDFAVRPRAFKFSTQSGLSLNTLKVKAGVSTPISFQALDDLNNSSDEYNETMDSSFKLDINISNIAKLCANGVFNISPAISFADGEDNRSNYIFDRVGEYNVSIKEIQGSEFAIVDRIDTNDSDRFIEPFMDTLKIVPDHFSISVTLRDASADDGFTYISNLPQQLGAELNITISAEDASGAILPNYSTSCYSKNADINISHSTPTSPDVNTIIIYDINTSTANNFDKNTTIQLLNISSNLFTTDVNGTAILSYKINIDRNITKPINPFRLNFADINYTDIDHISGNLNLDENITFIYARVHAPRYRIKGNDGNITHYYEVYCSDCNASSHNYGGSIGMSSVDSINWYRNPSHTSTALGQLLSTSTPRHSHPITTSNIDISSESVNYNGNNYPYRVVMDVNASPWLIYNRFNSTADVNSFDLEFNKKGTSSGTANMSNDSAEVNSNRRIMW
jgi:hypothetical protein